MTGRQQDTATMGAACVCHNFPAQFPARELRTAWLTLENTGSAAWDPGALRVAVDLDGHRLTTLDLPYAVDAGARVTLYWVFRTAAAAGRHRYDFHLVDRHDPAQSPLALLEATVDVTDPIVSETTRLRDRILETHARCWMPCDGMSWSSAAAGYPHFAKSARGCRTIDLEGREFVDYLMGWGCALLGYANERIQAAVRDALDSAAILTLTHHLMPEVADALCARFESAQAVTFGKNGSDACTAAVRMARVHTGRHVVLFSGYHGWQDWYVERYGMAATGVPEKTGPLVFQFPPNDLEALGNLLIQHRGDVAAVMLEPAGVIESFSGPMQPADAGFLEELIAMAHREGALAIFDEILTGFRHPGGSVQQATRTRPDLTCLGKGLASGMPLSALIGRRDVFDSAIARIHYEPTYKGEAYSLAAAREALKIYDEQDVPGQIAYFGDSLRRAIDATCQAVELDAAVVGPSFRMLLAFREPDPRRRSLMRTLVQQELFRNGVLTTQLLMLPSTAHDAKALAVTAAAFERALTVLAQAMREDRFAAYLEIPPLPA
jgi:glutamate-1-semialdehyde aminotransferase